VPPLNITHTSTHTHTHSRTHARLYINTHTHTHTHRCRGCLYSSRLCHWKMNVPVPPLKIQQAPLHTQKHPFSRSPPPPLILFNLSQCAQSYHYISCPAGNHTNTNTPSSSLFVSPSRSFSFHPTRRVYHCHHRRSDRHPRSHPLSFPLSIFLTLDFGPLSLSHPHPHPPPPTHTQTHAGPLSYTITYPPSLIEEHIYAWTHGFTRHM